MAELANHYFQLLYINKRGAARAMLAKSNEAF